MPTKTIITTVTLGIHDPEQDSPEVKNHDGTLLMPATKGTKYVLPGEPVTLERDEANKILLRYGGEEVEDPEVTLPRPRRLSRLRRLLPLRLPQDAAAAAAAKAPLGARLALLPGALPRSQGQELTVIDFDALIGPPVYGMFARPITVTPLASQPGQPAYPLRASGGSSTSTLRRRAGSTRARRTRSTSTSPTSPSRPHRRTR